MALFVRYQPIALGGGGGGGGVTTVGLIDSQTPSSNGAVIVGSSLFMQSASLTDPGLVNNAAQSFSGVKTFASAPILSSLTASLPLQLDGSKNIVSLAIDLSGTQATGILAASRFPALTGDITTIAGALATTLATVNSNVGSFTNASITVNAKGLVTAASSGSTGNLTSTPTTNLVVTGGTGAVLGSGTLLTLTGASIVEATSAVLTITGATNAVLGTGVSIQVKQASTSQSGYLSSTDWNTFNGKQNALTLTNLTDAGTDGITVTNGTGAVIGASPVTLSQHVADTTHNGYLSSTDWNTFNGKQAAGNYITALTGDVTASGPGSVAATLATVNGNVGSFGDSSHIPNFTVNAKGLITAAGSTASTAVAAASIFAGWDANKNLSANNHLEGYTTTATAAGTTTLTVGSTYQQYFTGSTTQIVALPVTSTLVLGMQFNIVNLSSGSVTVNSSGGNLVATVVANSAAIVTVILTSGTTAASWSSVSSSGASGSAVAPTVQKFTSGTAQTYTTPTNPAPLYIQVRMVGGGGGGAGSGTATVGSGGVGGITTFGTSLLVANGGVGGSGTTVQGGAGGTASLGTGPIGTAIQGGTGQSGAGATTLIPAVGGCGASSPFGGQGNGTVTGSNGIAAIANSGSGGGGAGSGAVASDFSGAGGGAGGYVNAIITSPLTTYTYTVGTAGTAGSAGTSGSTGGAGGSGYIEVTEYYAGNSTGGTPVSNQTANTIYAGPASGGAAAPTFRALVNADVAPVSSLDLVTGVAVHGTNTNNSASAGYVGEYVESVLSSLTNFPATTVWGDGTSISLTAGDWDVTVLLDSPWNTSTINVFGPQVGVSSTSGNSSTGLVFGSNAAATSPPGSTGDSVVAIPSFRVSLASTTTYFLKVRMDYSGGTTPRYRARLSARRMR